tara:strand:- start:61 stop:363 length:303 start_codon:yes stop_codon:yes gene_type:complete
MNAAGTINDNVVKATRFYNGGDGTGNQYPSTSKVPFVTSGICVFKRDGRAPTIDVDTKERRVDTDLQGVVKFETTIDVYEEERLGKYAKRRCEQCGCNYR